MPLGANTEAAAGRVGRNPVARTVGRLGLVARGVVYCVVAVLAVRIATGEFERADKRGALASILRQPSGRVMLVVLAIGFAAYAASCFVKAAAGAAEGGSPRTGARGTAKRLLDAGTGVVYLGLLSTTLAVAYQGNSGSQSGEAEQEWTAELLQHQYGQVLVELVGVALVVIGCSLLFRGIGQSFDKHLRIDQMPPRARRLMTLAGTAGYVARGVIVGLIGVFVLVAAIRFDPEESVGVDGALKRLAGESYGPAMLLLVAVGLFCFGLFSFVEARFRKVLQA